MGGEGGVEKGERVLEGNEGRLLSLFQDSLDECEYYEVIEEDTNLYSSQHA